MGQAWKKTPIVVYHAQNLFYLQFTRGGSKLEDGIYLLLEGANALGVNVLDLKLIKSRAL